jgi:Ca2+-binding RTX toxin-like protein
MPDRLSLGDGTCPTGTTGAPYYCVPGNPGNDNIVGGSGRDTVAGGSGNDSIRVRDGARDRVNCGSGRDTVTADRVDRIARNCERVRRSSPRRTSGAAEPAARR